MNVISKDDINKNWSKIFKDYRTKYNLTQEELAEKLGISDKYISRVETGKSGIKTQTLIKYINILGITPNVIFKDLVENPQVQESIKLSEKIESLSDEKKQFVNNIIDELIKITH